MSSDAGYFMYVVRCSDGTLYTGYARDVEARVQAHNDGRGAKYTRARRPVVLEAFGCFSTKHDAMSAEAHFKMLTRSQKEDILASCDSKEAFVCVLEKLIGK